MRIAQIGHSEIVKDLLIQPQINVNKRFRIEKMTAKEIATHNGHVNIVKLLMRCPKTQIDNNKMDAFDTLYTSVSSIRNTLLKSRHTCCLNANEVLLMAVIKNDPRAIKGLGQCPNADINTIDIKGRTPLYLSLWLGNKQATEEILKHNNVNLNKRRQTDGSESEGNSEEASRDHPRDHRGPGRGQVPPG